MAIEPTQHAAASEGDAQRIESLRLEAEHSFRAGEEYRQRVGVNNLASLLALNDEDIENVLGLTEMPTDFNFDRDWMSPTATYEIQGAIAGPQGTQLEIAGVRIQSKIVDRTGEGAQEHGQIFITRGGTRVTFVEAQREGDVWRIKDLSAKKAHMVDEGAGLAAAMSPKNLGFRFRERLGQLLKSINREDLLPVADPMGIDGGAKADVIVALPTGASNYDQKEYTARALFQLGYQLTKQGAIGPFTDGLAGDRGTTFEIGGRPVIEYIADGRIAALKEMYPNDKINYELERATVTGKQIGGHLSRFYATGLGVGENLFAVAQALGVDLQGQRIMSRGIGSAVNRAVQEAARRGMIVSAIADLSGIITCEKGFTAEDAAQLYDVSVNRRESIASWARKQPEERGIVVFSEPEVDMSTPEKAKLISLAVREYWKDTQVPFIFEGADQMTLNQESAYDVPENAVIIEAANAACTPTASDILDSRGVVRATGINANGMGAFVSDIEWAQAVLDVAFAPEIVDRMIREVMQDNTRAVFTLVKKAKEYDIPLNHEQAYYVYAIAQGLRDRARMRAIIAGNGNNARDIEYR